MRKILSLVLLGCLGVAVLPAAPVQAANHTATKLAGKGHKHRHHKHHKKHIHRT